MKIISSVHLDESGSLQGLLKAIDSALEKGAKSLFILLCSDIELNTKELPSVFASLPVPVYAGVFPGIIHDFNHYNKGFMVCGFAVEISSTVIKDITRPYTDITKEIKQLIDACLPEGLLVFVDGQSKGIDNLVLGLYDSLGSTSCVIGGGTGCLDMIHRPCIITQDGCYKDAAILFCLPASIELGVRHGWNSFAGPYLITEAYDNIIKSINYEPALPFYRKIIQQYCQAPIDFSNFFEVSKSYPLGMVQLDNEFLVRGPISRFGDSIEVAGSVPLNSMVYILHSQPEDLIKSAAQASKDVKGKLSSDYSSDKEYHTITIDCISRALLLGEQYKDELEAIREELPGNTTTIGALTLGEIANSSQGVIRFLNKTTVIGGVRC